MLKNDLINIINDSKDRLLSSLKENSVKYEYNETLALLNKSSGYAELKNYVKYLDECHPDIESIFSGLINDEQFKLALKEDLSYILNIDNWQYVTYKDKVRLLKDNKLKSLLRKQRKIVGLNVNASFWDQIPYTFDSYFRFKIIEEKLANEKIERFDKLGCHFLSSVIKEDLDKLKRNNYVGFKNIKLDIAALTLAKFLNFDLVENKICYKLLDEDIEYCPKVYPLHILKNYLNPFINKIINRLEKLPSLNNKSAFDFFYILIPSLKFNNSEKIFNYFKQKYNLSNNIDSFYKDVDLILTKNNFFQPILLAERNNLCYFVSHF